MRLTDLLNSNSFKLKRVNVSTIKVGDIVVLDSENHTRIVGSQDLKNIKGITYLFDDSYDNNKNMVRKVVVKK